MDHAHAPLGIAGRLGAPLGLLNAAPVIVPPFLMSTLLALEEGNPARIHELLSATSRFVTWTRTSVFSVTLMVLLNVMAMLLMFLNRMLLPKPRSMNLGTRNARGIFASFGPAQ